VLIIAIVALLSVISGTQVPSGWQVGAGRVALIRVDGIIVAGESGWSPLAGAATGSDDVVKQIERALREGDVRALLVRVNSPGGSAAGSQEIYQALLRARRQKPVVVSMADVAASGGYYISAPATRIYADPATITGSIGVISLHEDMSGLLGKLGVKTEIMKAGRFKDMGSPFGPMSPEVRQLMAALLKETHEQFIADVVKGRQDAGLTEAEVRKLADGRIYSGAQAKASKLTDATGGLQEALAEAGRLAGIVGKPRLKEYGPPGLLRWLFGGSGSRHRGQVTVTSGLLYDEFAARLVRGAIEAKAAPRDM